ncbi:MAG TPA: translation initiation factor IF-1 [Vicinamibacterales bacterium]|nr:translation initiation factor IF-1 [Vicinamibacterales bacterium]
MAAGAGRTEVPGTVAEQLPKALYRVTLDSGHEVTAHLSGDPRRNFIRILAGDRVLVALSPRDLRRGRIVERL